MTATAKWFVVTLLVVNACVVALAQGLDSSSAGTRNPGGQNGAVVGLSKAQPVPLDESPVSQVRKHRSWEFGPFANFGNGIGGDRSQYWFTSIGFQGGKILTPTLRAGILSGQFEYDASIMPFWQAYTPAPHIQTFVFQGQTYHQLVGGGTYTGASIMPVIFRWNFLTHTKQIQPWFQAAGGIIYTTHKFPPDVLVPHGTPGATSVWNFCPQGGIGLHYFLRPGRSIDLSANGVHISSASLGDHNPGVNAMWQIQVGYTFWR